MSKGHKIYCRECGEAFVALRPHAAFCSNKCRKDWNNRRAVRGSIVYDALMSMRYDREAAKQAGVDWTTLCRIAEMFNTQDQQGSGPQRGKSYRVASELMEEYGCRINSRRVV